MNEIKEMKSVTIVPEELPERVNTIIAWQVGRVARRFRLSAADREELTSHIRGKVLVALRTKYNPQRASVVTFANWVVRNHICKWIKAEIRRSKIFVPMTPELEERLANRPAPDAEYEKELLRIAQVRQTVAALSPISRRICELYMKYDSFDKVRKALHKSPRDFFKVLWPQCQEEFKKHFRTFSGFLAR